ncbi:MAG: tetraacyldisaccharide 4'-kinase, partial [Phycisphaerae bacterium]|nr:tetraacyldisaccharide 4'-kinase [Phycisphaerae bacterium]
MDARREREVEGLEGARRGPAPGWLGVPLARVYGAVVGWRNARFDRGVGVTRVGVPVVSVGNVSVGGTGKTPMVMWLARRLMERGERPAIALRGYKGGRGGAGSDEATEFRRWLPEVPLAVGGDRVATIGALRGSAEGARVSCVLLDDGFQHRRLHRDLDVVLVDATRDPFADRLLPAGWLREPVEGLKRAGAVVLTRYDAGDAGHLSLRERLEQTHGGRVLTAAAQWGGL